MSGFEKRDIDEHPDEELCRTRIVMFPNSNEDTGNLPFFFSDWTDAQLKHINYYLIEFTVNSESLKGKSEVKPVTMKSYLLGIQRGFEQEWGYWLKILEGPIFACSKFGLVPVVENRFSKQQARGMILESHRTLSRADLSILYNSPWLSRDTPHGFQARIMFDVALVTAMRPTAMATMQAQQVKKLMVDGENVWTISGVIGSRVGASKSNVGGWNAVRERPNEVCVWDTEAFDGILNVYKDLRHYMSVRHNIDWGTDQLFLSINPYGKKMREFFKRQHLGRNKFPQIMKEGCSNAGIYGIGFSSGITAHGFRGTVVTRLESGCSDATVAMRTGHRDLRSLKNDHNLIGKQQQECICGDDGKRQKLEAVHGVGDVRKCEEVTNGMENDTGAENIATKDYVKGLQKFNSVEDGGNRDGTGNHTGVLSEVKTISRGNFTINIHNHYR